MKVDYDDSNYQGMINKLAKGSMEQKSVSLKKLLFLYENARSKIYLYERRIAECLELLLLIEENDLSLNALTLLEKIIINTSAQSDIMIIVKKKLLSKMVLNLGSIQITIRKVSHRCVLEYLRKFKDFQAIINCYLKTAINQSDNPHLKLKAINSIHSLLMSQNKYFNHSHLYALTLIESLISLSYQKQHHDARRAAILCLIYILRIQGSQQNLKIIKQQSQNELYELTFQSQQLADLLRSIMKYKSQQKITEKQDQQDNELYHDNAPSPKFLTLHDIDMKQAMNIEKDIVLYEKIPQSQLRTFNDVTNAEQFLNRIENSSNWDIQEIQQFAQYIEKYLVDDSIKLFRISKKIIEVVFDSEKGKKKQYYVVLVPCVVNGIENKRFIVRKNLDKLARQYLKNHTEVWVQSFLEKLALTSNYKIKEILLQLFMHAYRSSPQFYFPSEKTLPVLDRQICDRNSNLKWKALDCIILVIQRQSVTEKEREQMFSILSPDVYNRLLRKLNKVNISIGSQKQGLSNQPLSPQSNPNRRSKNKKRLLTEHDPLLSVGKQHDRKDNVSQGKEKELIQYKGLKKARKSQIDIDFRGKRLQQLPPSDKKNQKQQRTSIQRLPELKRNKNSYLIKIEQTTALSNANYDSPVKKSMTEKGIYYIEKQRLQSFDNPKNQLEKALIQIRDASWNTQFQSVNIIRTIIEHHRELITQDNLPVILNQLLICLNSLRSGVCKISMICLQELMKKFNKKMYPHTQIITQALLKKSSVTSQFIQEQIKKCLVISVEELCLSKYISTINSFKDNKSLEVKMGILLMIETMSQNQKIYRKQYEWIWQTILQFHQEPQHNLRVQCKKIVKNIIEQHKDWKNDVIDLKKGQLEKIDKILKNLQTNRLNNSQWIEVENQQFQRVLANKIMTSKYFANEYSKFEEQDRAYTIKKNWKDRIRLLNDVFSTAFQHPSQFEANSNARKYIWIACQQVDEKNPGLLLNAISILNKSLQHFPQLLQQCLGPLLERILLVIDTKRAQLIAAGQKLINKIYKKIDINKVFKELLKLSAGNNQKVKSEAITQLVNQLKDIQQVELSSNLENILVKVMGKLAINSSNNGDKNGQISAKLKELVGISTRKLGVDFIQKINKNEKLAELIQ